MPGGRPRKPVAEHQLAGTYRADRHDRHDDGGDLEVLVRPKSLTGRAAEVWDDYTTLLSGVVRRRDIPVLAVLCQWVAWFDGLAEQMNTHPAGSAEALRLVKPLGIATDKVDKLASRFGLNPTDRAKVPQGEGPRAAKVPTRPRTKLDAQGGGRDDEA